MSGNRRFRQRSVPDDGQATDAGYVLLQSVRLGILYVVAQLLGGVVGAAAAFSSLPSERHTTF